MIERTRGWQISEFDSIERVGSQVSCELDGETIILGLADGIYYGLDPVGTRIWEILQERKTLNEIRDILLEEFDVEADVCMRELKELLQDLLVKGLIEVVP